MENLLAVTEIMAMIHDIKIKNLWPNNGIRFYPSIGYWTNWMY